MNAQVDAVSGILKRGFDFLVALAALLLLSPVLLALALIIKVGSPGPVFYRGVRIGLHGNRFRIYKFRTMVIDAECGVENDRHPDERLAWRAIPIVVLCGMSSDQRGQLQVEDAFEKPTDLPVLLQRIANLCGL